MASELSEWAMEEARRVAGIIHRNRAVSLKRIVQEFASALYAAYERGVKATRCLNGCDPAEISTEAYERGRREAWKQAWDMVATEHDEATNWTAHVDLVMDRWGALCDAVKARIDAKPGEPVGTDTNQPEGGK